LRLKLKARGVTLVSTETSAGSQIGKLDVRFRRQQAPVVLGMIDDNDQQPLEASDQSGKGALPIE